MMTGIVAVLRLRASQACAACLLIAAVARAAQNDSALHPLISELSQSGGLSVFVDCRDFSRIAELRVSGRWLVHCLYGEPETVEEAREFWQARGVYGRISAGPMPSGRLPFANNLVNVLVLGNVALPVEYELNGNEITRILAPRGRVYLRTSARAADLAESLRSSGLIQRDSLDGWLSFTKPYPADMDEWTHYLHGPDGNAVSRDSTIGVSRNLRWIAGPLWARHHDFAPSLSAMVSAEGRLFYIIDEAAPGIAGMPGKWSLVARDAFSGIVLWKQPIAEWGWRHWTRTEVDTFNRQNTPFELTRRLVAVGDRVYVTLGINAPVSELDAQTGEILRNFEHTQNTSGFLYHNGRLILSVNSEPQRVMEPRERHGVDKTVVVLDLKSGAAVWRKSPYAGVTARTNPERNAGVLFLCAGGSNVFLLEKDAVVCLDLADGAERWRVPVPERKTQPQRSRILLTVPCALVYHGGTLYFGQFHPNVYAHRDGSLRGQILTMTLLAIDADGGRIRWQYDGAGIACTAPPDVFVTQERVWIYKKGEPTLLGLDPSDGRIVKTIPVDDVLRTNHHHRCYGNKATSRYILTAKEGIEYIDLQSGEIATCHWVRGMCRYGIMPANGLIYAPPHQCGCFIDAKLKGFLALGSEPTADARQIGASGQIERGPAYGADAPSSVAVPPRSDDWPTYRHDPARSGRATADVSATLKQAWATGIGGRLSSPVVADGRVLVASVDMHTVHAIDAVSGTELWHHTVGGRVDSPPTYWRGYVLFGSHDGYVYCLRAADGVRVWRFRAAPEESRIVAFGQIESPWPVHGSVVVLEGRVYFAAGRSAHLDSGMFLYCLKASTGEVIQRVRLSADTSSKGELQGAALSDILVSDGETIWMRKRQFDAQDISRPVTSGAVPPVCATAGLLDDSWFNRTFWVFDGKCPAQYLVFDGKTAYGIRAYQKFHWKAFRDVFTPAKEGYQLFASGEPRKTEGKAKDKRRGFSFPDEWAVRIPVRAHAMVVTDTRLFLAGGPDVIDPQDPWAALEGRQRGLLCAFSKSDGKQQSKFQLSALPVYDGMAAAGGRLYLCLKGGNVVCLAGPNR